MKIVYAILLTSIVSLGLCQEEKTFGSIYEIPFSLEGHVYFPSHDLNGLPKVLDPKKAAGSIHTNILNITEKPFENGFPGVSSKSHNFVIDYHGFFYISDKKAGMHEFKLISDDGSKLLIDDVLVIDHDGIHPFTSKVGKINLTTGVHKMNVQYFQGQPYNLGLELKYRTDMQAEFEYFDFTNHKPIKLHSSNKSSGEIHLELESFLLFEKSQHTLKDESHQVLDEVFKSYMKGDDSKRMIIEGHTDLSGSESYNANLSIKRAQSVADYLESKFNIVGKVLQIGFGESKPRYKNDSDENKKKNRRVEIKIMDKDKALKYFTSMSSKYITIKK